MNIKSPRDALEAIVAYCSNPAGPLAAPMTDAHRNMAETVTKAAVAGLTAPSSGEFGMMPTKAAGLRDALEQIRVAASEPGRHYLPSPWVLAMVRQALEYLCKQPHDPILVQYALAYVDLARSGDAGSLLDPTELAEALDLLEPLRPLPPVPENIAAMLAKAREQQMIDGQQLDELRDLARQMPPTGKVLVQYRFGDAWRDCTEDEVTTHQYATVRRLHLDPSGPSWSAK